MAIFALLMAILLVVVQRLTVDKIAIEQEKFRLKLLYEVCQLSYGIDQITVESLPISPQMQTELNSQKDSITVVKTQTGQSFYLLDFVAPDGYSGDIEMLMAVTKQGVISGVRVINHKETPGLGDKIELAKSDWITHFNQLSLESYSFNQWAITKDGGVFDAFTGATVTPRAVVNAIKKALVTFNDYQQYQNYE